MQKRLFEPGEYVVSPSGERGIVISSLEYSRLRQRFSEKRRPGCYFAVGCCPTPDFITKIPILFEDESITVMKPSGIKRLVAGQDDEEVLMRLRSYLE